MKTLNLRKWMEQDVIIMAIRLCLLMIFIALLSYSEQDVVNDDYIICFPSIFTLLQPLHLLTFAVPRRYRLKPEAAP